MLENYEIKDDIFVNEVNKIIKIYKDKDRKYRSNHPIYLLRAFLPLHFKLDNFLTDIDNAADLWKFADSQHEHRFFKCLNILKKVSSDELLMLEKVSKKFGDTQRIFNRPTNPVGINQQLSSIPTLRIVSSLEKKKGKKLKILEIGGGTGMLGHMCEVLGHQYFNFEVTQSFYIFNSIFCRKMHKNNFFDLGVDIENVNNDILINSQKSVNLIPWWIFLNKNVSIPDIDVFVINHSFYEISPLAIKFILSRASYGRKEKAQLIVSHWGSPNHTKINEKLKKEIENKFNFNLESFEGHTDVNPIGTILISFKKNEQFSNEKIINPIKVKSNKEYSHFSIKKILGKFLEIFKNKIFDKKYVIGDNQPKIINNPKIKETYTKDLTDVIELVNSLEDYFKKPVCTEDEVNSLFTDHNKHI